MTLPSSVVKIKEVCFNLFLPRSADLRTDNSWYVELGGSFSSEVFQPGYSEGVSSCKSCIEVLPLSGLNIESRIQEHREL